MPFTVFSVGWELDLIKRLLVPVARQTGIRFVHGLVGDAGLVEEASRVLPGQSFVPLSKHRSEQLPAADLDFLAGLESVGVPSVRAMILGDRVLRYRSERHVLGYATMLARNLDRALETHQPDLVLGSQDSLHAAMGLAVAKFRNVPWASMAFSVIPDNLTAFTKALTPDQLVPLHREVTEELRAEARNIIHRVRNREQKVLAYRPPSSFGEKVGQLRRSGQNLYRRMFESSSMGVDKFTFPSSVERGADLFRRALNRKLLPTSRMIAKPPSGPFAYYPLHMAPESMLDTWAPHFQDQLSFIKQLSFSLPIDLELVVKLHFSDPDNYSRSSLMKILDLPRVRIAHPDAPGAEFIEAAKFVIGIQGTSCLEAAIRGKPVLIFGDSPYQHFPSVERAKRPDQIYRQIFEMLQKKMPSDDDIESAYTKHLARYLPGRINNWSEPISREDEVAYSNCFENLRSAVVEDRALGDWYRGAPFGDSK